MPRQPQSQWDFGELFAPAATRRVLTVSELTLQVKRLLEGQFGSLWVSGEVSNLRVQSSGHAYFTLKDAGAQLACVLFRGAARAQRDLLEDGRKVLLQGEVTVYEPRGQYQMVVKAVELQGIGALQLAFERLKQRLQAEGLFASERKRPLPPLPERIGIVTSPTGAALRDVLHVVARRQPSLRLVLAPCRVQGDGAAGEIAAAIRFLNEFSTATATVTGDATNRLDLILVTRGGGSLEDLWAFNEEPVARAIFESALPVVSAIGHEIDFTISDFVADLRAATPSAAAEILTQGAVAAREVVADARDRLPTLARAGREACRRDFQGLLDRVARAHPRRRVNEAWQRLDDHLGTLARTGRFGLREAQTRWDVARASWLRLHPAQRLARHVDEVARARSRVLELGGRALMEQRQQLAALQGRLRLLSPEQTLARGYSITRDASTGKVLRQPETVAPGTVLNTRLQGGDLRSVAG
jgi:exodeoxyribonuclease VII large subunit